MKRIAGICLLAASVSGLTGCGWVWGEKGYFRDRGNDYLNAQTTPEMQLAEQGHVKRLDPLLPIPHRVATVEQRPDYQVPRPQALASSDETGEFSVQKSGALSWVVAQRIPAQVWPVAQKFFEINGFKIASERPHLGEFTTQWQTASELDAGIVQQVWGSAPLDQQTRFRVRIEPGVQRNSSDIFIDQAQRSLGSSSEGSWTANTSTQAESAALLHELNRYLELSHEGGDSYSLIASKTYDAPKRIALVDGGNGVKVLRLDATFDRAWSSVGRALNAADIAVYDLNRSAGLYYIDLAKKAEQGEPGFFKRLFSSKKKAPEQASTERFAVRLTAINQQVFVNVERDADTLAPVDVAERVLEQVQTHLE